MILHEEILLDFHGGPTYDKDPSTWGGGSQRDAGETEGAPPRAAGFAAGGGALPRNVGPPDAGKSGGLPPESPGGASASDTLTAAQ